MSQWCACIVSAPQNFTNNVKSALLEPGCLANSLPAGVSKIQNGSCAFMNLDCTFACSVCNASFASKQACSLHMHKKHGWLHPAHFHVLGPTCPICLKNFATRTRALEHVMYSSSKCLYHLLLQGPALTYEEALRLLSDSSSFETATVRQGYRRAKAFYPVTQAHGPRLPLLPI